jgi:hypothetical protein
MRILSLKRREFAVVGMSRMGAVLLRERAGKGVSIGFCASGWTAMICGMYLYATYVDFLQTASCVEIVGTSANDIS